MRWMIASDLHGSGLYTARLMEALHREEPDRLLLLGDILYHGPRNDLPEGYAPKEVIALLAKEKERILGVKGNCEADIDAVVLPFPMAADYALFEFGARTVFATHGHVYNLEHLPPLRRGDILLHGHTHRPAWEPFGEDNYYLNPGSVSLPKDGTPRGYLLVDRGEALWKTLEGEIYHRLSL